MSEDGGGKDLLSTSVTRRSFLKGTAAAAGVVATGVQMPDSRMPERREKLQEAPGTLIIDIAPSEQSERSILQQDKFVEFSHVMEGFNADPDAQLAIENFLEAYRGHGEEVANAYYVGMLVAGRSPESINAVMEPLQTSEIFNLDNLSVETDELGNSTYRLSIPVEELDKIIKAHPEQKIVNLSFPLEAGVRVVKRERVPEEITVAPQYDFETHELIGYYVMPKSSLDSLKSRGDEAGIRYQTDDRRNIFELKSEEEVEEEEERIRSKFTEVIEFETPFVTVSEGYELGRERQVLEKMVQLANQNSEHVIVTSLGNNPVDIRGAREDLADNWPNNLIIMGQWDGENGEPKFNAHGADIYIENNEINELPVLENAPKVGNGSSFSSGFESGYTEGQYGDLEPAEIVNGIKNFATKRAYQDEEGVHTETLVLDGDSFKF